MSIAAAFEPGEPVMVRLFAPPWFGRATFEGYEPDPFDESRLVYRVRIAGAVEDDVVPPLMVHRDGPEFQAWAQAALAFRALELSRDEPALVHARPVLKALAKSLFDLHPYRATFAAMTTPMGGYDARD